MGGAVIFQGYVHPPEKLTKALHRFRAFGIHEDAWN
jgi:hypothetical protein